MSETHNKPPKERPRLPKHLKRRFRPGGKLLKVEEILNRLGLHTVCQGAHCPNRWECFGCGTATFLILGDTCTRNCRFCAIPTNPRPAPPDPGEPAKLAQAVEALGLKYVVITSVTRDDLPLGGAGQFAECVRRLRAQGPEVRVEVLVPDFQGIAEAIDMVLDAGPDVFNHNIETVPALYPNVRPQADYAQSLAVLRRAADREGTMAVKSGLMVGLGETPDQILSVFDDLVAAGCDILTIGQYLAPSDAHHPVVEYVEPEQFKWYRERALERGLAQVVSDPFVRSSYQARETYDKIQR